MTWYAACKKKGTWKEIGTTEDLVDYILSIKSVFSTESAIDLLSGSDYFVGDNAKIIVPDLMAGNLGKVVRDAMIYDIDYDLKHYKIFEHYELHFDCLRIDDDGEEYEDFTVMHFVWNPMEVSEEVLHEVWMNSDWDLYYDSDQSEFDNLLFS